MADHYSRELFPIENRRQMESVTLLEGSYLECPPSWQVPMLRYAYHRMYYIYGGKAYYDCEGETGLLQANHLYIFPTKAKPYAIHQDIKEPLRVLWCHFELIPDITNGVIDIDVGRHSPAAYLIAAWRDVADLPMPGNEIRALITALLYLTDRYIGFSFSDFAFEGVERYIAECMAEKLDVASVATHFGYTRSHFTRKFTEAFGMTPGDYLRVVRMSRASIMLLAGYGLEEICAQIGFEDRKAFTRAFGKYYGVSPSAYRKKYYHSQ